MKAALPLVAIGTHIAQDTVRRAGAAQETTVRRRRPPSWAGARRSRAGVLLMRCALIVVVALLLPAAPAHAAGRRQVVRVQQGKVRAELSYQLTSDGYSWQHGRLRIWNGKRLLAERRIAYGEKAYGMRPLAIRQLDGVGAREVLFTEFSGGSCGCVTTWIYAGAGRVRAPWAIAPAIRDGDGDGKPEFHGVWGLGVSWGSRADYRFPVRVWSYAGGALHDVTRAFPAEVRADQSAQYAEFQSRLADHNVGGARDAIAAYAADGYTLGQGDAAMSVLQAAVDGGQLDDPQGGVSTSEFLSQVRTALREQGYVADGDMS